MKVSGLLHATFLVANLERSRVFYGDVLGLKSDVSRPDLGFPGIWYGIGTGQQIHLMQLPNPEAGLERSMYGGRDRHVALAVDDLVELKRRFDQAGIGYSQSQSGRQALFCRDPDGNALEFIERQ